MNSIALQVPKLREKFLGANKVSTFKRTSKVVG
jgi:hypothetical protein